MSRTGQTNDGTNKLALGIFQNNKDHESDPPSEPGIVNRKLSQR